LARCEPEQKAAAAAHALLEKDDCKDCKDKDEAKKPTPEEIAYDKQRANEIFMQIRQSYASWLQEINKIRQQMAEEAGNAIISMYQKASESESNRAQKWEQAFLGAG